MNNHGPKTIPTISPKQIRAAYNESYDSSDHLRDSDTSYRWVLEKLKVARGTALLDIACGHGVLLKEAELKGLHCTGVDISISAAKIASDSCPDSIVMVANGEHLPFMDQTFETITNLGSLEHFIYPEIGIQEICRILRPGGKVAILLPNSYYLGDLILKVWRKGYGPNHRQILERFATVNEWKDFIEANGLKVDAVHKYNFFLPKTRADWGWFRKHPRRLIPPLLGLVTPFNFSFSFLYICSVK
ncbi:MAG TPA: methyltransferase domain-containing protein [Chryseolinea sp.]|nr:methyltransferase domain-containing protein [Chryseolinea sp.]